MIHSSVRIQTGLNSQINKLINQCNQANKLIIKNADLRDILFHCVAIDSGVEEIYSTLQVVHNQEVEMKVSKNKIHHYLNELKVVNDMNTNIPQQEVFDPIELVNNAITTCSSAHKSKRITTFILNKQVKIIGNSKLYLQAVFSLINSVLEYASKSVRMKLKAKSRGDNKVNLEFSISVPKIKNKETSQSAISSFNKSLNRNLFIVRKLLKKMSGQLIICNQEQYATNFVISVNFLKCGT